MTHTKGPWNVSDYEIGKMMNANGPAITGIDIEHSVGQGLFEVVARIPAPMFEWPSEEDKANARLIAAAPDLLRELEQVEWIADGDPVGRHCPWCGYYEHAGHISDCTRQAAIDRARGVKQ